MADRNFRVPSGLGGIKRVIIREPNPPPEMIYPEEEQAEEQIGAVRPVIPNAPPPPPIIEVPTVVAPPQVRDDYAAIRPDKIADRSTKDFLESGSAGSTVEIDINTPIVPLAAGVGPAGASWGAASLYRQLINIRTEDRKSIPLTVFFDSQFINNYIGGLGTDYWYDFTAILRWGVEGSSVEAEVDIRDGMAVSLCASSLTVSVGLRQWFTLGAGLPAVAPNVRIGAFVAKGAYGKPEAQRSVLAFNPPGTNQVRWLIPSFAKSVDVCDVAYIHRQRIVDVIASAGYQIDRHIIGANQHAPLIHIPNGAVNIAEYPEPLAGPNFTYGIARFGLGF